MKKLQFNFFSVLAIVSAIGTAFTTKPQKESLQIHVVWGLTQGGVSTQYPGPSIINLVTSIKELLYSSTVSLPSAGYNSLQQFRSQYPNGDLMCYQNNEYVCMAYVQYDIDYPLSGLVLELLNGEYDHIED